MENASQSSHGMVEHWNSGMLGSNNFFKEMKAQDFVQIAQIWRIHLAKLSCFSKLTP
jgi:hypothetical protein